MSPICPSFSMRCIRITCMSSSPARRLLQHVRKQRQEAGTLDRTRQLTLLLGRHGGDAARHDLAALRNEALQQARVLVVDLRRLRPGERAALAANAEGATATAADDALDAHSGSKARQVGKEFGRSDTVARWP